MDETIEGPLPLHCTDCGDLKIEENGGLLDVVESGTELPDDGWYFHVKDFDEVDEETGDIKGIEAEMYCPDCKPAEALPTE